MGKVKFQVSWQKDWSWLKSSKTSAKYAFCMASKKDLHITAGICLVQDHEEREKRLNNIKQWKKQSTYTWWEIGYV